MLGLNAELAEAWATLPTGPVGGSVGEAAESARPVIDIDVRVSPRWSALREVAAAAGVLSSWSVPVSGAAGRTGVITVLRDRVGRPTRDELDLAALYAGHAAGALEREEAERAQQEAMTLRRSQDLQQAFLTRLSHELRTPLTAIRGYASSLLAPDVVWDEESQHRFLGRIAGESDRLGRLVDDLLDFSAIQADILRLSLDWCDLALVIDAAVACLPPEGVAAVTVAAAPALPVIWADHDRLEQVLVNLMDNAFRHNGPGTSIEVSAARVGANTVEVVVADDGRGLPEEVADEPFRAGRERRGPTAGAGLGLSIAKGIVDAHGGTLTVDRPPRGTRFRLRLAVEAGGADDTDHRVVARAGG
jgi:signal transduction histidine kinase